MLVIRTYINDYSLQEILGVVKKCLAEFFWLQWTHIGNEVLISSGWFVPAVFFGGLIFVMLLALTGKVGGGVVAPLISVFVYFVCRQIQQMLEKHLKEQGALKSESSKERKWQQKCNNATNWSCLVLSNMIFWGIFIYTNFGYHSKLDFLIIFLYALSLLLLMLSKAKLPPKAEQLFVAMGNVTYPIYIFQMPIIELLLIF